MHRPLLLRGARQLLTLRGAEGPRRGAACLDLGIINDGSVLMRDGVIVSVGQSRRVDNLSEARNAIVLEAHGAVVMPAFVDANLSIPANAAAARRILQLAFLHGSTTAGICGTYFPLRSLAAAEPTVTSVVPTLEVEREIDEPQLLRAVRRNLAAFLRLDLLAHTREELRLLHSLGPALRVFCGSDERPDWVGLALAYGASVLDVDRPLDKSQIALLSDSPASVIVNPGAAPVVRALLQGDVAVALGSGFATGGGGTCSMLAAAARVAREGELDIAEALTMATVNAAHALGIAGVCGSLQVGKKADLLILHLSDYRDLPDFTGVNVVSKIVHAGTLVS